MRARVQADAWSSDSFREEEVSMRCHVAADLDDDLPVPREPDVARIAPEAHAVHEHGDAAAERQQAVSAERAAPDREQVAERPRCTVVDEHDAGGRLRAHGVATAPPGDADPARDDDNLAVREQLDVHGERAAAADAAHAAGRRPGRDARVVRRRLVLRADADRPRVDRWRGCEDHAVLLFSCSPITAAPAPALKASAHTSRARVGENDEMTTACRNTPSDPSVVAAAAAPISAASTVRRSPCTRRSPTPAASATKAASPSWIHATRPVGESATPNEASEATAARPPAAPSATVSAARRAGSRRQAATAAATPSPPTASQGHTAGRR